jgi:hypothetical protein
MLFLKQCTLCDVLGLAVSSQQNKDQRTETSDILTISDHLVAFPAGKSIFCTRATNFHELQEKIYNFMFFAKISLL